MLLFCRFFNQPSREPYLLYVKAVLHEHFLNTCRITYGQIASELIVVSGGGEDGGDVRAWQDDFQARRRCSRQNHLIFFKKTSGQLNPPQKTGVAVAQGQSQGLVIGSIPLVCRSKCPWARYWNPKLLLMCWSAPCMAATGVCVCMNDCKLLLTKASDKYRKCEQNCASFMRRQDNLQVFSEDFEILSSCVSGNKTAFDNLQLKTGYF